MLGSYRNNVDSAIDDDSKSCSKERYRDHEQSYDGIACVTMYSSQYRRAIVVMLKESKDRSTTNIVVPYTNMRYTMPRIAK